MSAAGAPGRHGSVLLLRRAVLPVLLACVVLTSAAVPALAHASLVESTPSDGAVLASPPTSVTLVFDEPVRPVEGGTRLFAGAAAPVVVSARAVDRTVLVSLPPLDDGGYTLAYRVVSADGHPVGGTVRFGVGDAAPTGATAAAGEAPPVAVERTAAVLGAVQYLGLLLAVGLLCFETLVRRTPLTPSTVRPVRAGALAATAASVLLVPVSALRLAGLGLGAVLTPSAWSPTLPLVGQQALVAGVVALGTAGVWLCARPRGLPRLALAVAALTVVSPLLTGHTQSVEPRWLAQTADAVHLCAAGIWLGGVFGLAQLLRGAGTAARAARTPAAAHALRRFSTLAAATLVAVAASGVAMALLTLPSPASLVETAYGRTLIVKVLLVAAVVAMAAWNRLRLIPHVRATGARTPWERLRRVVRVEAGLLASVVVVTGSLTLLSPAHGSGAVRPAAAELTVQSQGLDVTGVLEPAGVGTATFTFTLAHQGEPVVTDDVTVQAWLPDADLGPLDATVHPGSGGTVVADLDLPVAGAWELVVAARISTYERPIAVLEVAIF